MGLVVRTYNYRAGDVAIAEQNNVNEDTLYDVVNGNIDDDNLGTVTETSITFLTSSSGHSHDGANSRKINITADTSPESYLVNLSATASGNALTVTCSAANQAGIYALGAHASAYGAWVDHALSGSVALLVNNQGLGTPIQAVNAIGNSTHSVVIENKSTNATVQAGLYIAVVDDTDHYGIWVEDTEGVNCRLERTGTTAQKNALQVVSDNTTNAVSIQMTGAAAGLQVDHSGNFYSARVLNSSTGNSVEGIRVDLTGATGTHKGMRVDVDSNATNCVGVEVDMVDGIGVNVASASDTINGLVVVMSGDGPAANFQGAYAASGAALVEIANSGGAAGKYGLYVNTNTAGSSGVGGGLYVRNQAVNAPGATIEADVTDTLGTTASQNWVLRVINPSFSLNENAAYFEGDIYSTHDVRAAGTKSFLNPHPEKPDKAIRYVCLEGPENAVFWRTRVQGRQGKEFHVFLPTWVFLAIPEGEEMDVFCSGGEAYHDVASQSIRGKSRRDGKVAILCLGTRRYFEHHDPVVEHDWREQRGKVGSSAHQAYGPL